MQPGVVQIGWDAGSSRRSRARLTRRSSDLTLMHRKQLERKKRPMQSDERIRGQAEFLRI